MLVTALVIALAAPAADDLASTMAAARKSGASTWLSWSVPSATDGNACCWDNRESRAANSCSLASNSYGMNMSSDDGRPADPTLVVYAHVAGGEVDKLRVYSASCRIDRGGETVREVAGVGAAESVAYLESLVKASDDDRAAKRRADGALSAIAMHDDKSADAVLERVARDGETKQLRHSAAFWLGNTRERAGYDALLRLRGSEDAAFRDHLTFCFSQSKVKEASATLIDMAKTDPSPRVRGQALFWIAQKARKAADGDVIRAATDDPDLEVKKKAVFALSQIPHGEGVPDLIRVAQENKSREVRKQAMFWLGQSKDPRALEFFEKILTR
ncbi:MAG: HEAT repeat domain-containing protein [Vicinamibacteria bacterium]|nr:HEAT repeat domain-containing protein [Vicinamibacteria bacterium]